MKSRIITSFAALALLAATSVFGQESHTSTKFAGPKANTGTVTHMVVDGKNVLTLSDDFKVPGTPDPHWQVVDSKGNTYLLQKLSIKGDKINRRIAVPAYVQMGEKSRSGAPFPRDTSGKPPLTTLFHSPTNNY